MCTSVLTADSVLVYHGSRILTYVKILENLHGVNYYSLLLLYIWFIIFICAKIKKPISIHEQMILWDEDNLCGPIVS